MPKSSRLTRMMDHGPGHPLAWIVWSVPAFFFLYEYILRILPGIIEHTLEREFAVNESQIGGALGMYYFAYAHAAGGGHPARRYVPDPAGGAAVLCAIGMVVFPMSSTEFAWRAAGSSSASDPRSPSPPSTWRWSGSPPGRCPC